MLSRNTAIREVPNYGEDFDVLLRLVTDGWQRAQDGCRDLSLSAYAAADAMLPGSASFNPSLSVLRHIAGKGTGVVVPIPPTEDRVVSFILGETSIESPDNWGMQRTKIGGLEKNIRDFIVGYDSGFHRKNITADLPHVLVLSTGRCGTVSLYRLFGRSRLLPYHTYWWSLSPSTRWEFMCRIIDGKPDNTVANLWASTRAAEWLGAISVGRPLIGLNHLDTIFAPVLAALHGKSKFVHLHRRPVAVFESFFRKNQWGETQLRPLDYAFSPSFRFRRPVLDLPSCLAWYIEFTATFSQAVGKVVGPDRFLDVSSDKLFAQDREEIRRLIEFTESGLKLDDAVDHFAKKINAKMHKIDVTDDDLRGPRDVFTAALAALTQRTETNVSIPYPAL